MVLFWCPDMPTTLTADRNLRRAFPDLTTPLV